jgi:hypothetical protein
LLRQKPNRRRAERAALGKCYKRRWRDLEEATKHVVGALSGTRIRIRAMAIYFCAECTSYHQSSRLDGQDVVRVVEREDVP